MLSKVDRNWPKIHLLASKIFKYPGYSGYIFRKNIKDIWIFYTSQEVCNTILNLNGTHKVGNKESYWKQHIRIAIILRLQVHVYMQRWEKVGLHDSLSKK